jgi:hypothetical protein
VIEMQRDGMLIVYQQCRLISDVFSMTNETTAVTRPYAAQIGYGMRPLAEIAASNEKVAAKLSALFALPAWWLHGYYGVPPEQSLLLCRTVRHPATVARWLLIRCADAVGLRSQRHLNAQHQRT